MVEVVAQYTFYNPTQAEVALQLGFPEYRCETNDKDEREFCIGDSKFRFENMQTRVRGTAVRQRLGHVRKGHEWAPLLGRVWLLNDALAPGERVPIEHRYRVPAGYDSTGGQSADYVTRTGALWAQPMGAHASRF